jgi:hypothetical protein
MIFTRRVLQRCLNELSGLSRESMEHIVAKLNEPSSARLPAMWEVMILHALNGFGNVEYERDQPSGRRPDITFTSPAGFSFVADITCVSDAGLDEANPVVELSSAIEACKSRLGLPLGGMALEVEGERTKTKRGERTRLLLPKKGEIERFVRTRIEPAFRQQMANQAMVLEFKVNEPQVRFAVRVQDNGGFNYTHYPSYNTPGSLTVNPVYNALNNKVKQLRDVEGVKGVIVCDGDCDTLRPKGPASNSRYPERKILEEFLRQNSSVHFAVALSVKQEPSSWLSRDKKPQIVATFVGQRGFTLGPALAELFRAMAERMPTPKNTPDNAALRAREPGYGWGNHGGSSMSNRSLKISSRLLLELLAGKRSIGEVHKLQHWRFKADPQDNRSTLNQFERWLDEGRLPVAITVERDPEGSDDWVEFEFGDPDPAVSPFKVPS